MSAFDTDDLADGALHPSKLDVTTLPQGSGVRVTARGELDLATVPILTEALEAPHDITLDLQGVEFIDSSGIHLLLKTASRAEEQGTAFRLVPSDAVNRLLTMVGVVEQFRYAEPGDAAP